MILIKQSIKLSISKKITKMENGILSRVGMVPPHKWDEFDKELNKTFGTNPVIDFIKK